MSVRTISIARALLAFAMVIALAPAVPGSALAAEDGADSGTANATTSQQPLFTLDGSPGNSAPQADSGGLADEGEVTKAPTCTEQGIRTVTLPDSGVVYEEPIPALGHSFAGTWNTESKTAGKTVESRTCVRCGAREMRTTTVTLKQNTTWERIWGQTAPVTMQKIAAKFGKTKSAIVTTDSSYKDALAASALAGKCNGLVLMTKKGSLTAQTKAALKASGVKNVYILGSTANVSAAVEKQLKSGTGVTKVVRVSATTPSQRAVAAAKYGGKKSDTVIIATQNGFQDALSIAPYSYATKSPILYAEANKKLSPATLSYIKSAKYKKAIIVGGPIALPASIDTQLKGAGVTSITRLAGANLYSTSQLVADWSTGNLKNGSYGTYQGKALSYVKFGPSVKMQPNKLAVSTGQNWLDALSGAALCGKNKSVMLLADTKTAKSDYRIAAGWCGSHKTAIKNGYVLGGTSALSKTVWDALVDSTRTVEEQVSKSELVEAPTAVAFSLEPGCYKDDSITLELSTTTACEIHYTLDGSVPTKSSALYQGPITLKDRTPEPSIVFSDEACSSMVAVPPSPIDDPALPKANVVRAVCIAKDGRTGPVATGTYFVGQDLRELYGEAPVISIVTDPANLIGYETGILVTGRLFDEWVLTEGSGDVLADPNKWEFIQANYSQSGKAWERPASIEVLPEGARKYAFDCGIRVKGGFSRTYGQRSFNVYLRESYGQPSIDYPLISSLVGYDGQVVTNFSSFTLRNGGNEAQGLKFRDTFLQELVADRAFSTQPTVLAIVFLNGEYAGPYNLQEKITAEFYAHHYGVDAGNVVVIKEGELEEGEDDDFGLYKELLSYADEDLSDPAVWERFKAVVDIESMAEYCATQIYIGNEDWDQDQNTMLWRTRDASGESPYADARWRWSLYDTDYSTGIYGLYGFWGRPDYLARAIKLQPLFESALHNGEFRALFMERLEEIGSTNFDSERVDAVLAGYVRQWRPFMTDYYRRFGDTSDLWDSRLRNLQMYFSGCYDATIEYARQDLAAFE